MRVCGFPLCGLALFHAAIARIPVQIRAHTSITSSDGFPSSSNSTLTSSNGASSTRPATISESESPSVTTITSSLEVTEAATYSRSDATNLGAIATGFYNTTAQQVADGALPLTPVLTPAIGVAGVIMLVSGCFYTFGGVRYPGICNFMSSTYMIALLMALLLVYLLQRPVSNGVQGGYLVGVVVSRLFSDFSHISPTT